MTLSASLTALYRTQMYITSFIIQHYEKLPMQYMRELFQLKKKNENFVEKKNDIFNIYAQNIDYGHTLEPPRRGGSNEFPQSMFWIKIKKKCISLYALVLLYKSGV